MQQVYKQSDKIFNALRTFVNILKGIKMDIIDIFVFITTRNGKFK